VAVLWVAAVVEVRVAVMQVLDIWVTASWEVHVVECLLFPAWVILAAWAAQVAWRVFSSWCMPGFHLVVVPLFAVLRLSAAEAAVGWLLVGAEVAEEVASCLCSRWKDFFTLMA